MNFRALPILLLFLGLAACGSSTEPNSSGNRTSPGFCEEELDDIPYCSTPITYSGGITITGTAQYQAREPFGNPGTGGLGAAGAARPIRNAEVRVLDSNGNVAQCSETGVSGELNFDLPNNGQTYTVHVMARANNAKLRAKIMDAPESQNVYSVSTSFVADSTKSIGNVTATVTGQILGGAFNIYDQVYEANEFLRAEVGTCSFAGCADFTVAPEVKIFWQAGFSPGDYFNAGPLSFYIPSTSCLFILGGDNGNVNSVDTDHFDNSVILHEYGHFLEDVMTVSDSPGGAHSGNKIIDPRLAWSEGFGNFFQAAVLDDPYYIDTTGNSDGSTNYIFKIPLENTSETWMNCGGAPLTPGCDVPTQAYEGNFREFSIARFLFDVDDDATEGGDSVNAEFEELWASLVSSDGFRKATAAFRSIGLMLDYQDTGLTGASDWSSLHSAHFTDPDRQEYARYVDNTGGCGSFNFSIDGVDDPNDTGSFGTSNLLTNNDFFHYKHSGGSMNLRLRYTTAAGQEPDMDLYLYEGDARYGSSSDMAGNSQDYFSAPAFGDIEQEDINLSSLSSGDYLINIKIYTGVNPESSSINGIAPGAPFPEGDATTYELTVNGVRLCPASLP